MITGETRKICNMKTEIAFNYQTKNFAFLTYSMKHDEIINACIKSINSENK